MISWIPDVLLVDSFLFFTVSNIKKFWISSNFKNYNILNLIGAIILHWIQLTINQFSQIFCSMISDGTSYLINETKFCYNFLYFIWQIDLLTAITHAKDTVVWEHVFSPREYLVSHLEEFFSKTINRLLNYNEATHEIAKPSALLKDIRSYITSLHRLEEFVNLDMGRIFNTTLLLQTLNCDNTGGPTLTSTYTFWWD